MADNTPETPGSSASTGVAVGLGAALGATTLVGVASVLFPPLGLGMIALSPAAGAAVGGYLGWVFGGKK